MANLKIAILTPSLFGGGAEDVARNWSQGLSSLGHSVTVILSHSVVPTEKLNYRVVSTADKSKLRLMIRIFTLLRREKFDVVVSILTLSNLLNLFANILQPNNRKYLSVISEHTLNFNANQSSSTPKILLLAAQLLYRRADVAIGPSTSVIEELEFGFRISANKLQKISNPVFANIPNSNLRGEVTRSDSSLRIVYAGRLSPEKNVGLLPLVVGKLRDKLDYDPILVVFGDGPLRWELEATCNLMGIRSEFHGWVSSWWSISQENSVFVLPSKNEGFGNVLVQANLAGMPTASFASSGGVMDACVEGITGFHAFSDTPESLANCILKASSLNLPNDLAWLSQYSLTSSSVSLQNLIQSSIRQLKGNRL